MRLKHKGPAPVGEPCSITKKSGLERGAVRAPEEVLAADPVPDVGTVVVVVRAATTVRAEKTGASGVLDTIDVITTRDRDLTQALDAGDVVAAGASVHPDVEPPRRRRDVLHDVVAGIAESFADP
jgi:hypothetical protein